MKIEKVTYQKTYSIGPYLTDRVGFEASLDGHESCKEALSQLEAAADEWHKKEHPHLHQQNASWNPDDEFPEYMKTKIEFGPSPIIDKSIERLEIAIDNAASLEELDKLKADNPLFPARLLESFNKKRKELTNGQG